MTGSDSSPESSPTRLRPPSPSGSDNGMDIISDPQPQEGPASSHTDTPMIRQPVGFASIAPNIVTAPTNAQAPASVGNTLQAPQTLHQLITSTTAQNSALAALAATASAKALRTAPTTGTEVSDAAATTSSETPSATATSSTQASNTAPATIDLTATPESPSTQPAGKKGKGKGKSKSTTGRSKGTRKGKGKESSLATNASDLSNPLFTNISAGQMTFRLDDTFNQGASTFRFNPQQMMSQPSAGGQPGVFGGQSSGQYYRNNYDQISESAETRRARANASRNPNNPPTEFTDMHAQPTTASFTTSIAQHMSNASSFSLPAHQEAPHIPRELINFTNQSLPEDADIVVPPVLVPSIPATLIHTPNMRVLRILTLLIEDMRGGQSVDMLVELRVPLKQTDNPEDGYWADAQEVSEELQSSPSRIEGRGKVYAMRGKYRQYFLRVTPEEGVHTSSANLKVSLDRTLQIFVEDLPSSVERAVTQRSTASTVRTSTASDMTTATLGAGARPVALDDYDQSNYHVGSSTGKRQRSSSDNAQQYQQTADVNRQRASPSTQAVPESPITTHTPSQASIPPDSPSPIPSPVLTPQQRQGISTSSQTSFVSSQTMVSSPLAQLPRPVHPSSPNKKTKRAATNVAPAYPSERRGIIPSIIPQTQDQGTSSVSVSVSAMSTSDPFGPWSNRPSETQSSSHSFSSLSTNSAPAVNPGPFASYGGGFRGFSGQTGEIAVASSSRVLSSALPSASATLLSPENNEIVGHLRAIFTNEKPQWDQYVKRKNSVLKISELIEQYKYVQGKLDAYVGTRAPSNLVHAANAEINKDHIMSVFGLGLRPKWIEDCTETLTLNKYYGPKGERCEDPRAVEMFDAESQISTSIQGEQYLKLLKEIHSRWTTERAANG